MKSYLTMKHIRGSRKLGWLVLLASSAAFARADIPPALESSLQQALENNPEVQFTWNRLNAAEFGVDASRADFLPSIDLGARSGRQQSADASTRTFSSSEAELTLVQTLFNGFRTQNEVGQSRAQLRVSFYEFLEQMDSTTLEAFIAYQDVLRHRELVSLAEENVAQHENVFQQISDSASAGVARSVDLEQISGRLALAETNLLTEKSNLHDVIARFNRVVGNAPPDTMEPTGFTSAVLPQNVDTALSIALSNNPQFLASGYSIVAAEREIDVRQSNNYPTVDLNVAHRVTTHDGLGNRDSRNETRAGIEMRYNLFRGGRDRANIYAAHAEANAFRDLRVKACTDLRQTLQIAMNDVESLSLQRRHLNQHRISSSRVRTAYKQQFDIGQRTLLDVLDAENEHFQASRAFANATYDYQIAVARSLAAQGTLRSSLGVLRSDMPIIADESQGAQPIMSSGCRTES